MTEKEAVIFFENKKQYLKVISIYDADSFFVINAIPKEAYKRQKIDGWVDTTYSLDKNSKKILSFNPLHFKR